MRAPSLHRYFNASQLRSDSWYRLHRRADRLRLAAEAGRDLAESRAAVAETLEVLRPIESLFAFPGKRVFTYLEEVLEAGEHEDLAHIARRVVAALTSRSYRRRSIPLLAEESDDLEELAGETEPEDVDEERAPYFEVLLVEGFSDDEEGRLVRGLRQARRSEDRFVYETVQVSSFEDAIFAILINHHLQSCVIGHDFAEKSNHDLAVVAEYMGALRREGSLEAGGEQERAAVLAEAIGSLRPEVDCFLVSGASVEEMAGALPRNVRRLFYQWEDYLELHLNLLRGIAERYQTPFFTALKEYSRQPTGVFHAMPISRGKSIVKSNWIQDMARFYGINIFLAETSATSGGLDSLLSPTGPIKRAQELAARAFGARRTYFVTNGTSTANKIVVQAVVKPGDIVLVDRNCHKSHHYGLVLAGAEVCYLDSYPLDSYSMYGAVPLVEIKRALLRYQRAGRLDRVKMLLLTNCTFDGIVYHPERVMQECLAIKEDLVFLWDEAWFAFAYFSPVYRQRTAMEAANRLRRRFRSEAYRAEYERFREGFGSPDPEDEETWLSTPLLPDPERARVRVYATQSTHKTLTALRQGSMIHVHDQDFANLVQDPFHEAYMTHTSTSPNYQIVASLDVGRRQVQLEGFELVEKQLEMAMVLREKVTSHPLLQRHFTFLSTGELIPPAHRRSGIEFYYDEAQGFTPMWSSWADDEFVLDPTRLTLFIGQTGIDGDTFKNRYLMERYGIQINKTSRNSVLFMTNIGTTRSSVAYLIEALVSLARELDDAQEERNPVERELQAKHVHSLTEELPPLPDFSRFHDRFRPRPDADTPEGDMRAAYFLAYDGAACEYLSLTDGTLDRALAASREVVSAIFVIPYPPGFPILVPGQVVSEEILEFLRRLDVREIHGYRPELGLRVFTQRALAHEGPVAAAAAEAR